MCEILGDLWRYPCWPCLGGMLLVVTSCERKLAAVVARELPQATMGFRGSQVRILSSR